MDRLPGGLDDGPRVSGRVRPAGQRLYVWLPLCLLFLAPFVPWRRTRTWSAGRGKRAWSLLHLDLLVLLGFSISLAFFNHGLIGISTPIMYPFMLYLLVRMLLLGFGRARPREPLRLCVPVSWLAIGVIFLVGFRIGLNVINSNVIDVGYAGVIGANKVLHDQPLYGNWPNDNSQGDTYGPVNYYAYVPFRASSAGAAPGTTFPPRTPRRSPSTC